MTIKDQLNTKFETRKGEIKRKKQEERIKRKAKTKEYKKLKQESKQLIDERLTKIVLNTPFYDESEWIRIKAKDCEYPYRISDERLLILDNGYIIDKDDVKKFCRKNKLKVRYEYVSESFSKREIYRCYRGKQFRNFHNNIPEYFESYIITTK